MMIFIQPTTEPRLNINAVKLEARRYDYTIDETEYIATADHKRPHKDDEKLHWQSVSVFYDDDDVINVHHCVETGVETWTVCYHMQDYTDLDRPLTHDELRNLMIAHVGVYPR